LLDSVLKKITSVWSTNEHFSHYAVSCDDLPLGLKDANI